MDVGRFAPIQRHEEEPIRPDSEDRRHLIAFYPAKPRLAWAPLRVLRVAGAVCAPTAATPSLGELSIQAPRSYPLAATGVNMRANSITHCRWSGVSGTEHPRAALIARKASSGWFPPKTKRQAAINADLPIPCRQWIATLLPPAKRRSNFLTKSKVALGEAGTLRSTIGKDRNSMRFARHSRASWARSRSSISSLVSNETTTSRPAERQLLTSSSSQSPPRGRDTMANLPCHGPSIHQSPGLTAPFGACGK
jgi:hypothetical protein